MENLKNALSVIIKVAEKTDESLADGKIGLSEGFAIALASLGFIKVIKGFDVIYDEYVGLTDEQSEELSKWFAEEFDVRSDTAEGIIEGLFSILINLNELLSVFKKDN